jgi:hypothetical protein
MTIDRVHGFIILAAARAVPAELRDDFIGWIMNDLRSFADCCDHDVHAAVDNARKRLRRHEAGADT